MAETNEDIFNPLQNEQTAEVIYLRYHMGYDHADIAEILGINEEGARHIAIQGLKRTKELVFGE